MLCVKTVKSNVIPSNNSHVQVTYIHKKKFSSRYMMIMMIIYRWVGVPIGT